MIATKRFALLTLGAFIVFLIPFLFGYHFTTIKDVSLEYIKNASRSRSLHLLLPATGPNVDFCKLLLSAAVTGYPEPIFIGWDGRGIYNGSQSHLFKITETLTYLRSLPPSADSDLVLLLDAYDIWLQLRPEIMIERYYHVLKQNDQRVKEEGLLNRFHGGARIHHSIVVGPDKVHWPQGEEDAATWAVPISMLPENAFGPDTDHNMITARPRWLNSGTIMGPVKDIRDYFSATVDMLSRKYDSNYEFRTSDQYYFAEVWAEQEIQRSRLRDGADFDEKPDVGNGVTGIVPDIPPGRRTEFHVCLDYSLELFQTAAGFERHLTWMRHNQTSKAYPDLTTNPDEPEPEVASGPAKELRIDQWLLQDDIMASEPPFAAIDSSWTDTPPEQSWSEALLGTNVVTQLVYPLFHITGDKTLRDRWWPRMWFHPHAELLLKATKHNQHSRSNTAQSRKAGLRDGQYVFATAAGATWRGALPIMASPRPATLAGQQEKGGAWIDTGEYVPWNYMCGAFEGPQLYIGQEDAGREMSQEEVNEMLGIVPVESMTELTPTSTPTPTPMPQ